ncbi:MAG TPA: glycosyltransferase family 39 protein [Patescibacteria group bacterium]|nr:glycosyltransferase family 39 protein [Patescibacteria group bacterium]
MKKYLVALNNFKYRNPLCLCILFVIGFLLRIYLIGQNLFFGPEQGRDMLVVKSIVIDHKLVLIGPTTAVEGIYHGPLYYYLSTIPFFFSKGNPLFIALFFIFLNALSVFLVYLVGKELFSRKIGLIASLFFTFSFGAVVMARWLSHPPLIIPVCCLFFLFLAKFIKGNNKYLIPTAIIYGVATQTEFSNLIIFTFITFFAVVVFRKRFLEQKIISLLIALALVILLPIFNFVLFDLRHNFLITRSLIKSQAHRPQFVGYFLHTLTGSIWQFMQVFSDVVSPLHLLVAAVIFIAAFFALIKLRDKYKTGTALMLIWLFSPFVAFILLRYNPLYHYFTASIIAIIILIVVLVDYLSSLKRGVGLIAIGILVAFNLWSLHAYLPNNLNVFFQSTQPDLKYKDQQAVIQRIYKEANGTPFYYQAYTIPYWMQDGWQYLFWYYGKQYGYLPKQTNKGLLFVIIQDDPSTKLYQTNWLRDTVSKWGIEENEFKYGILTVEKRYVQ